MKEGIRRRISDSLFFFNYEKYIILYKIFRIFTDFIIEEFNKENFSVLNNVLQVNNRVKKALWLANLYTTRGIQNLSY